MKAGQNNFGCESTLLKAGVNRKEFYLLLYSLVLKGVLLSSLLDHVVLFASMLRSMLLPVCLYRFISLV